MFRINLILWYFCYMKIIIIIIIIIIMNVIANSLIINKYYNSKENIYACAT
jgi:hypothetical protein